MVEPIKRADAADVQRLVAEGTADLDATCQVLAFGKNLAVIRAAVEIDPLLMDPSASPREKALFIWGIENYLRLNNVQAYYFNIHEEDVEWRKVVESWGAVQQSTGPEFRYKKTL